jgi:hypothetical protein
MKTGGFCREAKIVGKRGGGTMAGSMVKLKRVPVCSIQSEYWHLPSFGRVAWRLCRHRACRCRGEFWLTDLDAGNVRTITDMKATGNAMFCRVKVQKP